MIEQRMIEQRASVRTAFFFTLGSLALVGLLIGVVAWSTGESDRLTLPAGELFATWDVVVLHAFAVLPLAYALALAARRRFKERSSVLLAIAGAVFLAGVAVSFRLVGGLGMSEWLAGRELAARAFIRSVVSLLVLLPGAWLLLVAGARWVGRRLTAETDDYPRLTAATWTVCVLAFSVALPYWGYPRLTRKAVSVRDAQAQLGYAVEAQRIEEQLVVIAGEDRIASIADGLLRPRLAAQVTQLERQAATIGEDPASVFLRAVALVDLARYDEAKPLLVEVWERTGEPQALHQLGRLNFARRDYRQAHGRFSEEAEALRARLAAMPEAEQIKEWIAYALLQQARMAFQLVRLEDTLRLLKESLEMKESAEAHLWLARTQHMLGRGREGQSHIDRFLELDPTREAEVLSLRRELAQDTPDCAALSPVWRR